MPEAARVTDPIGHSPTMNWLVAGLLIGAAAAIAAVAIIGTGGLAAAAIVGGAAAGGAGIGELLSTMSWAPKEITGMIIGASGATDVFTNDLPAAKAHLDLVSCSKHSGTPPIASGSDSVFINDQPASRVDDKTACSAVIMDGSPNVFIGGGTVQTDPIQPEDLVPAWVHAALLTIGGAAAVILGGPIVAVAGFVGGYAGGTGGAWIGGKIWGQGSDGQKWAMLGGSLLGGLVGAKGGNALANRIVGTPNSASEAFLKGGIGEAENFNSSRAIARNAMSEGGMRYNSLSGGAKRLVNQLTDNQRAKVGNGVRVEDLRQASEYFDNEIAIVQNTETGSLSALRGNATRVPGNLIGENEEYLIHTHPTQYSEPSHFRIDIRNAGEHTEAVIDRGGNLTFFNRNGIVESPAESPINELGFITGYW